MSTTPTEILETTAAAIAQTMAETLPAVTEAAEEGFDFGSIKEIMDGFDPAALLPEMSSVFGSLAQVCRFAVMAGPIVMLVLGICYLFLAPKEANHYFGYRCYFGMGSVNAWRATQRLAGVVFGLLGLILTGVMLMISNAFPQMEVMDMVWKAVDCLVWQAALVLVATIAVNLTALLRFDRKGEYRRKKRKS